MSQVIECVPNFSEGRDSGVIDAIADSVKSTPGVSLLDVDPGASTNRTVFTFVGDKDAVVEAAFNAAKTARGLLDMRKHKGEHPRLGAMDVCPFIPVRGTSMEDCVECAERLGRRLGDELRLPAYLYGFAAKEDHRRTVPQIRSGEYEKLSSRIDQPEWLPDFGPATFVPEWGASMIGARKFLIAYNVNVLGTKEQAHRLALNIREQGRGSDKPGRLKCVQGIGWYLEESNMAQVSVNILDFEVTPIHRVFEECKADAEELQVGIAGSQIVGLVPLQALLQAADFYAKKENLMILHDDQKVRLAIDRLGLSSLGQFDPKQRIIEYMVEEEAGALVHLKLKDFVALVAARTSAPGGGSVSAVVAAMGAGLATMGGLLTFGNRKFEHLDSQMRQLLPKLHSSVTRILRLVDDDNRAFDEFMAACRRRTETDEQKEQKVKDKQEKLRKCVEVPLTLAREASALWDTLESLATLVNVNCKSDVQVAAKCLETGVFGAHCNVAINLVDIDDFDFKREVEIESTTMRDEAERRCREILRLLDERKE